MNQFSQLPLQKKSHSKGIDSITSREPSLLPLQAFGHGAAMKKRGKRRATYLTRFRVSAQFLVQLGPR